MTFTTPTDAETRPQRQIAEPPAHPVDRYVGARMRSRRKSLGISQTALADTLGVTFQQVQKYERGFNRISVSRLYEIAAALTVPFEWFVADYDATVAQVSAPALSLFSQTREARDLASAFDGVPRARRTMLVKALRPVIACFAAEQLDG